MSQLIQKIKQTVKRLEDFQGVDPTGVLDSTAGVLTAFAWLAGGGRKLTGTPGASYRVSASIPFRGTGVTFDGQECVIINAINGAPADPLFSLTGAQGGTFLTLQNFSVQFDQPSTKGHTVSVIGNGNSPQVVAIRNIRPNYQIGTGKDRNGAAMAAYAVYAYGVYTLYCDEIYAQNGSGGVFVDTVQKVSARRCTIDSATNYGMWFDGCASVFVEGMNNLTGCGQDAQASVYYNNCEKFVFKNNRVKGGLGVSILAGDTPSRSVTISDNHVEVYVSGKRAISAASNTDTLSIRDNYVKHIGGCGPFEAGIAVLDRVGAQSRGTISIRQNKIVVGGADTLNHGILLTTATDQINGAIVEGNTIGDRNAVAATITNAINLICIGNGNVVRNNVIGSANVTVTNGVSIGAGNTSADVKGNSFAGTVTNTLVNNGSGTRRYETKDITPVLKGKTTAGNHQYDVQIGSYRVVDDLVHFTATVDVKTFDAAMNGYAIIELDGGAVGMPKAKNRANQFFSVAISNEMMMTPGSCVGIKAFVQPGTSEVWFSFAIANAAATLATQANVNASFFVNVTGTYMLG